MTKEIKHRSPYVRDIMKQWHRFRDKEIDINKLREELAKVEEKYQYELPLRVKEEK